METLLNLKFPLSLKNGFPAPFLKTRHIRPQKLRCKLFEPVYNKAVSSKRNLKYFFNCFKPKMFKT